MTSSLQHTRVLRKVSPPAISRPRESCWPGLARCQLKRQISQAGRRSRSIAWLSVCHLGAASFFGMRSNLIHQNLLRLTGVYSHCGVTTRHHAPYRSCREKSSVPVRNHPFTTRRSVLIGGVALAGLTGLTANALAVEKTSVKSTSPRDSQGNSKMSTIKTKDGTEIFYKDWGKGQPLVFSHGWPLSADDWDTQMLFFLGHGYRVIAHDRRGHGRSSQTSDGHDMDHYADDLAALTAHLDLKNAIHIGHS